MEQREYQEFFYKSRLQASGANSRPDLLNFLTSWENRLHVGQEVEVRFTCCGSEYTALATVKKINVKSVNVVLTHGIFGSHSAGAGVRVPRVVCRGFSFTNGIFPASAATSDLNLLRNRWAQVAEAIHLARRNLHSRGVSFSEADRILERLYLIYRSSYTLMKQRLLDSVE